MSQYFADTMSSTDLNSITMFWSDVLEFWTVAWYSCISGLVAYVATINQHIGDEMGCVVVEHRRGFKHGVLLDSQCFGQVIHIAGHDVCFQFDSTFGYPGEGPIVGNSTKPQLTAEERGKLLNVKRREKRAEEKIKETPEAREQKNPTKRRKRAERTNKDAQEARKRRNITLRSKREERNNEEAEEARKRRKKARHKRKQVMTPHERTEQTEAAKNRKRSERERVEKLPGNARFTFWADKPHNLTRSELTS